MSASPDFESRPRTSQELTVGGIPGIRNAATERSRYRAARRTADAETSRAEFFRVYPGLREWHRRQGTATSFDRSTRTVAGRRRLAVERYTERLNTPVQGTGADGLKAALALLWETRERVPSAELVLCVHDEIVIECDAGEAEAAREWLVDCMTRGMRSFVRTVPIVVDAAIVMDWSGTAVSSNI